MLCDTQVARGTGFTLIELLVAISVLGFIAVLGWRGLDSITRTREILSRELEQARGLQIALAQWQTDCANVVNADALDGRAPLVIEGARMTLARRVQAEAQPGALQLVTWRVRDGILSREESPPTRDLSALDVWWQTAQSGSVPGIRLQQGVRSLALRVWTNDGRGWRRWEPGNSTLRSRAALMNPQAGSTSTQILWRGVEVSLQLEDRPAPLQKIFMLGSM
jgi:general secretion pathway protein J